MNIEDEQERKGLGMGYRGYDMIDDLDDLMISTKFFLFSFFFFSFFASLLFMASFTPYSTTTTPLSPPPPKPLPPPSPLPPGPPHCHTAYLPPTSRPRPLATLLMLLYITYCYCYYFSTSIISIDLYPWIYFSHVFALLVVFCRTRFIPLFFFFLLLFSCQGLWMNLVPWNLFFGLCFGVIGVYVPGRRRGW